MSVIDRLPLDKVSNIKIRNKHQHIQNFQTYLPTATFACAACNAAILHSGQLCHSLSRLFQSQNYLYWSVEQLLGRTFFKSMS